jgi:hypothetical protein
MVVLVLISPSAIVCICLCSRALCWLCCCSAVACRWYFRSPEACLDSLSGSAMTSASLYSSTTRPNRELSSADIGRYLRSHTQSYIPPVRLCARQYAGQAPHLAPAPSPCPTHSAVGPEAAFPLPSAHRAGLGSLSRRPPTTISLIPNALTSSPDPRPRLHHPSPSSFPSCDPASSTPASPPYTHPRTAQRTPPTGSPPRPC